MCQYATNDDKVCKNLKYVSIKSTQVDLKKCITWPKKFGKGHQEWNKTCIEVSLKPKKLNILMKTKFQTFNFLLHFCKSLIFSLF